ncbi:MAG: MoaD/ThiS family protein [Pseudoxanthomonas sp.]
MTALTVLYFASLRDASGVTSEEFQSAAVDLRALYEELQSRHGFVMPVNRLRVAVNGDFAHWDDGLIEGSEVALIPPVSGG